MCARFWPQRANRRGEMEAVSSREHAPVKPALGERIRVLLFTNSVAVGGMEEHVELLARHLDRDRFEVFAVCPDWQPTKPFSRSLAEVADHFALITPDRRHGGWRQLKETIKLARQMRHWRIQVIHMHSTTFRGQ